MAKPLVQREGGIKLFPSRAETIRLKIGKAEPVMNFCRRLFQARHGFELF